jgi:hypothetical protein
MSKIAGTVLDVTKGGFLPAAPGRRCAIALATAALLASAGVAPAQAGNSWALPLVGGALGGYAISSFVNSRKSEPAPVYHPAPRPVTHVPPPATPPATAQARLQQLDQLAAGGYITKAEYEQRRQAIISTL